MYESDGRIWFTRSNDAVNWSPEVCISNGVAGTDNHKYPSIVVKSEVANIVWQHEIGSGAFGVGKIFLRRYAIALDSWGTTQQIGQYNFPENVVSTPVIAANNLSIDGTQDNKRVAWNDPYGIKIRNNNNGTWGGVGTVPGTHSNCYYPSIINYNGGHYGLCWEDKTTETIEYVEPYYVSGWVWNNASQVSLVGWGLNQRPSMAIAGPSKPTVAWQSVDNVVERVSVHVRQKTFGAGAWENVTSFSLAAAAYPHPAVGTYKTNSNLSVTWNFSNNVYAATFNGFSWSGPSLLASGSSGGTETNINAQAPSLLAALWRKPDGGITITTNGVNPGGIQEESIAGGEIPTAVSRNSEISFVLPTS